MFYSPHIRDLDHHGGTALLIQVSQGVAFSHFSLNSPLQAVAMQLHLMRVFPICSLYRPPSVPVERKDLVSLVPNSPVHFHSQVILMGATLFGGDVVNTCSGGMIISLLEELDLDLLNNVSPKHFHEQNNFTSVFLCSSVAVIGFTWKVTEDLCGSDFYPILLSSSELVPTARVPRGRLNRTDWAIFRELSVVDSKVKVGGLC